jgi:hypothetical protein
MATEFFRHLSKFERVALVRLVTIDHVAPSKVARAFGVTRSVVGYHVTKSRQSNRSATNV